MAPSTKSFLDETEITNLTDRDGKDKREKSYNQKVWK
jgi:hypothetical protein